MTLVSLICTYIPYLNKIIDWHMFVCVCLLLPKLPEIALQFDHLINSVICNLFDTILLW